MCSETFIYLDKNATISTFIASLTVQIDCIVSVTNNCSLTL